MSRLIQQFYLLCIFLLLGCAAVGPPPGGMADKKGPVLRSISPDGVLNLALDQDITFDLMN